MLFNMHEDILNKKTINIRDFQLFLIKTIEDQSAPYTFTKHPLGFLCLNFFVNEDKRLRIHFWDRSFKFQQHPFWPIHNHSFDFSSLVMSGCIQNKKYRITEAGVDKNGCYKYKVSYSANNSILTICERVYSRVYEVENISKGEIYSVGYDEFHRSRCLSEHAITLMATRINKNGQGVYTLGTGFPEELIFERNVGDEGCYIKYAVKMLELI